MENRVSIAQVASHANVSAMTVSRVVRGRKHLVSADTYERVLASLHELNYVPTRSAFQNRHVETSTIGYVPHDLEVPHNRIDSLTLEGLCQTARRHGYDVLMLLRDEADWMVNRQVARFLDRRSDGFIILSPRRGEWHEMLEMLTEQEIPVVICYRRDVPEGIAWVDPDNEEVMRLAVAHLAEHGHSQMALLVGPSPTQKSSRAEVVEQPGIHDHFDDIERERYFRGFIDEFCQSGSRSSIVRVLDENWKLLPGTIELLLGQKITGIVCGDHIALQLWDEMDAAGLKVPNDFSIIGVDNMAEAAHRGLSSVAFGYEEVGRLAVQAWVELCEGKAARDCCKVVPVRLIRRQSVAQPHLLQP